MTQRDYIKEEQEQLESDRKAGVEGLPPIIEEKVAEYAERATIVYANFTGRDEKHRAQFRQEMLNLYRTALLEADKEGYARAMGEARREDKRYREIAELISSIFYYGNFKVETPNERQLEKLLTEVNLWPTNEDIIVKRTNAREVVTPTDNNK